MIARTSGRAILLYCKAGEVGKKIRPPRVGAAEVRRRCLEVEMQVPFDKLRAGFRLRPPRLPPLRVTALSFEQICEIPRYGFSGYSNSVKRGSSTMLWKSLSARAWSLFLGFSSMARARLPRQSWVRPVIESSRASP